MRAIIFTLGVGGIIGGTSLMIWRLIRAARATDDPPERRRQLYWVIGSLTLVLVAGGIAGAALPGALPRPVRGTLPVIAGVLYLCGALLNGWQLRNHRRRPVGGAFGASPRARERLLVLGIILNLFLLALQVAIYLI